jgi:hypothetical protein
VKKVTFKSKPVGSTGNADEWVSARPQPTEPVKRLTIDVPVSLHRRVKTACARENLVMADVVRELLDQRFPATAKPLESSNQSEATTADNSSIDFPAAPND